MRNRFATLAVVLLVAVVVSGCTSSSDPTATEKAPPPMGTASTPPDSTPSGPSCEPTPCNSPVTGVFEMTFSRCTELAHTLLIPHPIFSPDYPPGTRPAQGQ